MDKPPPGGGDLVTLDQLGHIAHAAWFVIGLLAGWIDLPALPLTAIH